MERDASPDTLPGSTHPPAETTGDGSATFEEIEGHQLLRRWADLAEVRALPEILRPSEGLVAVGSGTVVKSGRLAQSKWLVTLTDRRLLCIKGREAVSRKVIDMPASQIRGVETSGLLRKTLSLDTGFGTLRIGGMDKDVAGEMVRGITALMGAYEAGGPTAGAAVLRGRGSPAGEGATPAAEAGPGAAGPATESLEAMAELWEAIGGLEATVAELTDRVAFVEELVRSNLTGADETEVGV